MRSGDPAADEASLDRAIAREADVGLRHLARLRPLGVTVFLLIGLVLGPSSQVGAELWTTITPYLAVWLLLSLALLVLRTRVSLVRRAEAYVPALLDTPMMTIMMLSSLHPDSGGRVAAAQAQSLMFAIVLFGQMTARQGPYWTTVVATFIGMLLMGYTAGMQGPGLATLIAADVIFVGAALRG